MQLEELRKFRNQARVEPSEDKGREKEKVRQSQPVVGQGDKHKDN